MTSKRSCRFKAIFDVPGKQIPILCLKLGQAHFKSGSAGCCEHHEHYLTGANFGINSTNLISW